MTKDTVPMAFDPQGIVVPLEQILPLRKITAGVKQSPRYQRIVASIREIGVIEPLVIYPQNGKPRQYLLLDGLLRFEILKEIGKSDSSRSL